MDVKQSPGIEGIWRDNYLVRTVKSALQIIKKGRLTNNVKNHFFAGEAALTMSHTEKLKQLSKFFSTK